MPTAHCPTAPPRKKTLPSSEEKWQRRRKVEGSKVGAEVVS